MFQWLTNGSACRPAPGFKNALWSSLKSGIMLIFMVFQCPGPVLAGTSTPAWTVPIQLTSDDGYTFLDWALPEGETADFFKITETFKGQVSVHYTEAIGLRAWRIEPGEYDFVLQACQKDDGGTPDCGSLSETLTLQVTEAVTATLFTETTAQSVQTFSSASVEGGPDQLRPGQWFNPEKDGHGWSFYWSNRLALPLNDPLFGNSYDLVGIWYTYEAKMAVPDLGCPSCPPETGAYRPVVLKLKAISTGPDIFGGSLWLSSNDGSEIWVGSAEILFGSDNSNATISWSANFKKESSSATEPLVFLHGSDPADTSNVSHFSGVWKPDDDDRYYVVTGIGETAEVEVVVFHDAAGDPTWIQAVNSGTPVSGTSDFCLAYQKEGYSPQQSKPPGWSMDWHLSGCDPVLPINTPNRNGSRYFSGSAEKFFWADFTLPGTVFDSGSISIGTSSMPISLAKAASFHAVSYASTTGNSCELTSVTAICGVWLSWYTDGNYPEATVYAHNTSTNSYERVLTSTQPVMADVPYRISSEGVYEFELHMGEGAESTLIASSAEFTVSENIVDPIPQPGNPETPPARASRPSMRAGNGSSKVGATVGEFRVDESGSATYSIPILTAPASGGVGPQISLNYSSQSGNGELGVGWTLGGISTISLCPQTMEQDDISGSRGIGLDGEDRFCLDGQRLIADPASGEYGADGTIYHTEIDSFARITSNASAGNGPMWFRVERKNGSVVEYGNTDDSRIEARGSESPASVFVWAQNRFEDRSGNYILYSYLENSSGPVAYVLQTIDYTGNDRANTLPSARLTFTYIDRDTDTDLAYSYFAGVQLEQRHLLESISSQGRVQADSPLEYLRFYELVYEEDGVGRNILTALNECRSPARTICYKPTKFNWLKSESIIGTEATELNSLLPKSRLSGMLLADVSGDGRPDLLYTKSKDGRHFLHVKEAKANARFSKWEESYRLPKISTGSAPRLFAIDINSDGLQDVVYSKYAQSTRDYTWVALVSNGSGFSTEMELNPNHRFFHNGAEVEALFRIMDFNGDGLSDILHAHTNTMGINWKLVVLLNTTEAGGDPVLSAPIEVEVNNSTLFPSGLNGGWEISTRPPFYNLDIGGVERADKPDARIFDFNGDGAVDLLLKVWRSYSKCEFDCDDELPSSVGGGGSKSKADYQTIFASFWVLMESDGQNSFSRKAIVALGENCDALEICDAAEYAHLPRSNYVWPVDINADGLADLAWGDTDNNWYFQINTGNGYEPASFIGQVPEDTNELARFEDWNGDGYADLIYPSDTLSDNAKWMLHQNHFGRVFAAPFDTQVPAGNVGGDHDDDQVENDSSIFADFSGDGKTDLLSIDRKKTGEILSVQIRKGMNVSGSYAKKPANVITSIFTGLGAVTKITYMPLTDSNVYTRMYDSVAANWGQGAPVYDYIAPIYVVSEVSGSSPTFADPGARSRAEYHYVGAKLQAGGRGLLGFAEIITYDPQLQIRTNCRYRQDFPFIGLPVDTLRSNSASDTKFSPVTEVLAEQPVVWPEVSAGTEPPSSVIDTVLSYNVLQWQGVSLMDGVWQVFSDASLQRSHMLSGELESKVLTENTYDDYGNMTITIVRTYAGGGGMFSKRKTSNTWSAAVLPDWNLGRLGKSTVTHTRKGQSAVVRKSAFKYDSATGVLKKETIEPGSDSLKIVTTFSYDMFGNRKSTSRAGAGMARRTNSVLYDSLGRYINRETNALGQVFRKVKPGHRDVFGNPLKITNIDGVLSTSGIDGMGRTFASYNETGAWQKTLNYTGAGANCPQETVWHSITTNGGGAMTQQCFDVSGRTIRNVSNGLNNQLIYVDQYYDASGRPSRVSEPYFSGGSPYWNRTAYDRIGRITGLLSVGGDDISTNYDEQASNTCTEAGPGVIVTTNALGQQSIEVKNVLGETIESFDNGCGQVSFDYDSMGHLTRVTGADGSIVRVSYDGAGHKISLSDPDKGDWQYAYNALGEMVRQLDAKQQAIDFEYDALGRVRHRRELAGVSSLTDSVFTTVNHETTSYRTASPGKSQAATVTYRSGESGTVIHEQSMAYDDLGRISGVSSTIGSQQFFTQTTYDAYGRVFQQFDASGDDRGLRYAYRYGHLSQLKEAREGVNGVVYQHILDKDARGNVTMAELGNGVTAVADYDPASGHLVRLHAYDLLGVELQDVDYLFDVLGNLKVRHDRSGYSDLRESFNYDGLNRLLQVRLTAPALGLSNPVETLALNYDATGNISWKSDVGTYSYGAGPAGPHAVTQAGGKTYSYDINGNQTSGDGRDITYTVFDKAASLTAGNQSTTFTYGIGNDRLKREDSEMGVVTKTTVYLGSVEYITQPDGSTLFKRYLAGTAIATFYPATSNQQLSYLLKDHIGSIHSVLNKSGLITTRMHFSPFGERQDIDWQTSLDSFLYAPLNDLTTRGFTGHEHIDSMGIINMNGRIYDAKLGRFLQADPFIQAPKNTQSLNRYSYVLNNPLSYTDPSGYFSLSKFFKKWGRLIVAAVASYFTFGWAGNLAWGMMPSTAAGVATSAAYTASAVIAGATAGFVGGAIISGNFKGAVKGAFTGAIFASVAGYFGNTYSVNRIAADSLASGISSEIYGGDFRDGLLIGALVSSAVYINVKLRRYETDHSKGTPGQIGESPGHRGIAGKIGGARVNQDIWEETGQKVLENGGSTKEALQAYAKRFESLGYDASPLGCHQGGTGCIFGKDYKPGGVIDYVVEGFAGTHDYLNHPVYYNLNGTSKTLTGFHSRYGQFRNVTNVLLATPIVFPSLVPDHLRFLVPAATDK